MQQPSIRTMQVIDRTLFPGSHCINVAANTRIVMHKAVFMALSGSSEAMIETWTTKPKQNETKSRLLSTEPLSICIPPMRGTSTLPQQALLCFKNGDISSTPELLSSDCAIIFFRRSVSTDQKEITRTLHAHAHEDLVPIMQTAGRLFTPDAQAVMKDLMKAAIASLLRFYEVVDPTLAAPMLKQRVFSVGTDEYMGHICTTCGRIDQGMRKCPCGAYYCSSECQRKDWKKGHRTACTARRAVAE